MNLNTGELFNPRDGKNSEINITFSGITDMTHLASVHNHPLHGFNASSDIDIDNMLHNPNEKYCVVVSENKIWIVKNKYYNVDLRKKENINAITACLKLVNGIHDILTHNKINDLNDIESLESINMRTDKELTKIYEKYEFDSWIIPIE